jgi:predicted O-methyltransferase YrrM
MEIFDLDNFNYNELQRNITKNINGRICHHWIRILYRICEKFDIKNYMEIGVHNGSSMSYIVRHSSPKKCIGVDLWEDFKQRCYAKDKLSMQRTANNINKNNISNSRIHLIKSDSTSQKTLENVTKILGNELLDLLFVDGDHSYEGIKNDIEKYSGLIKPGGFLVVDDYNQKLYPQIVRYMDEFLSKNPSFTLIGVYEDNELIIRKNIE